MTPATRIRPQNERPLNADGGYVLYWMTANRRVRFNFALQRAVELALEFRKPLVILEALRVDYPHASDRFHAFVVEGMRVNAREASSSPALYYPYVEPHPGGGRGLVATLAGSAVAVVTDWYPVFVLPRMLAKAAAACQVRMEAIDSAGLIPVAEHGRAFPTARGYRGFVQRTLRSHLTQFPDETPLSRLPQLRASLPAGVAARWPMLDVTTAANTVVAHLPIDHAVARVQEGGAATASRTLKTFLEGRLGRYATEGNHPDADCTSHLSPYLHFGHISAHEIFSATMTAERWTTRKIGKVAAGSREGWWGTSAGAQHFLEQVVVWRELAFNGCAWIPALHSYDTLPGWAKATLDAHRGDPRPHVYSLEQLEAAETHDPIWNAAQRQLREDGWFHGYMRMLWGKKILEWCREPAEALDRMELLMNRYSLDGRDPVSYLNFGWVLGRYDRPWFERPIFGTVRYMTSESAKRKLKMKSYLEKYGRART